MNRMVDNFWRFSLPLSCHIIYDITTPNSQRFLHSYGIDNHTTFSERSSTLESWLTTFCLQSVETLFLPFQSKTFYVFQHTSMVVYLDFPSKSFNVWPRVLFISFPLVLLVSILVLPEKIRLIHKCKYDFNYS